MATAVQGIEDIRARREAVVKAHFKAETMDHDVAAALATFRQPRYEVPAAGVIADGTDAVRDFLTQVFAAFPDLWLEQKALYHSEHVVVVECKFGGTQRGVWAGVAPTGRKGEVECVLIFVFEGADLVCEKVYFDNATILRQLGALA
ncbi:MAG: ester cyclase [Bryobacterales bacterium]|nr:ester cyclase [Bryobacterales bacterium]